MRNKKLLVLAALLCAALTTAGIAVAKGGSGAVASTSASFDATTVANHVQKTCTVGGSGDTFSFTRATYTGTATSSDARLNGPVTIKAVSLVDTTTGVGALVGGFRIDGGSGAGTGGKIEAAISGGQASGIVRGRVAGPGGELFASVNSGFTGAGGFAGASIGSGSSTDAAVVLSRGACVHVIHHGALKVKVKLSLKLNF